MPRDYRHDWVKATKNNGGVLVHIPKGMLDALPIDPEADLEVKRYASNDRARVHLSLREAE